MIHLRQHQSNRERFTHQRDVHGEQHKRPQYHQYLRYCGHGLQWPRSSTIIVVEDEARDEPREAKHQQHQKHTGARIVQEDITRSLRSSEAATIASINLLVYVDRTKEYKQCCASLNEQPNLEFARRYRRGIGSGDDNTRDCLAQHYQRSER
jgi:hypothetical protein